METAPAYLSSIDSRLSFSDGDRMHVQQKKLAASRRSPAPEWINDPEKTRRVLVSYVEKRAGRATAGTGTLAERLKAAEAACVANNKYKLRTLNKLCAEYAKTRNPTRRQMLATQIKNLDANIFLTNRGIAALVLRAAFLYWRSGLSSPEVALELGRPVHPVCVRQWLHRLQVIARGLGYV